MGNCVWSFLQESEKKMAGRARQIYSSHFLKNFELLEIIDEAPSITEIRVLLHYETNGEFIENEVKFRLIINDDLDKKPLMRGMSNATWGIVNWGHGI